MMHSANLATSGYSVFLIEAGGNEVDSVLQSLPPRSAAAAESAGHGWQFFVQHYANETQARRDPKYTYIQPDGSYYVGLDPPEDAVPAGLYDPRGSTLGGSAQVNAMNFIWAPDNEWDYIAEVTGDETWGHEYVRRHLMALENATYVPSGTPGHGFDGFLEASQVNATTGLRAPNVAHFVQEMFRIAEGFEVEDTEQMAELLHRDINGIESDRWAGPASLFTTPVAISPTTQSRSGIGGYLNEVVAAGYPLTISLHSLATRVLFKHGGRVKRPRATGVEYWRYDPSQTAEIRSVRAKKEVIVSGGAFNTPQIPKLSGIGPREELEALEFPVLVDLPAVGVDRLWVVDASVFPRSPGGMPNGPTYTISRKAYEVILEDNEKGI
ncbi:hypothetical protein NLU13_5047 [Sarocladium strictum]|uniref:Glucose-methanol-choline oxidoreductase N-terminal domain-containing protein n=1 Tax=Sarocladium strictum TaxID=5046 RepID=A0AA39L9H1_SARSR|nr:hypothetical protein NLU13_5047 [Sarocladium strictum]